MKTQSFLSVLTALSASMCCITPVLAMTTGTTSLVTSLHWTEPLRPYFIGISVFVLGFAWIRAFKSSANDECGCEQKPKFIQSKTFLTIVTLVSGLLITFPSYSAYFLKDDSAAVALDQQEYSKIELPVKGMTCTSCEVHIESSLKKINGVRAVQASYSQGTTKIEYDPAKVNRDQLVAAINETGYSVGASSTLLDHKESCTKETCEVPLADLPKHKSANLATLNDLDQLRKAFNDQSKSVKFVAILSSTCKWCIQGAQSIQKSIIEKMNDKNIGVIVVWTNMLKSDDATTAQYSASMFDDKKNVVQFFDVKNLFGDVVARTINSKGEKAWDIYLFFDGTAQWNEKLPRPFEYVHQLGPDYTWVDRTKYFCGEKLTQRLDEITKSL
ncbi:MAG: mercuric transport protein MerTP [Bacteroidetes bacterium]|nr:mercuric transport protein MerTP [Bacteroidota bacterium]MBS1977826.1 mercuric transport protein MerTP [Bacteroidota bacterium]